jgi:hypothetical protein
VAEEVIDALVVGQLFLREPLIWRAAVLSDRGRNKLWT